MDHLPRRCHRSSVLVSAAALFAAMLSPAQAASAGQPTLAQRTAAAKTTATEHPDCQAIGRFYWSIGDASGVLADDRVGGVLAPTANTTMSIASASKLVYGAYVVQKRRGVLSADDVDFLRFTSGYTQFDLCLRDQTVAECQSYQSDVIHNGGYVAEHDGRFLYSGGHMQKHATLMNLGPDDNAALAGHINAMLGSQFDYTQPQLAGGVQTNAAEYGRFLQRVLGGQLKMKSWLGKNAVCTNPLTCSTAIGGPIPTDESWHYSIGHWVEDDPAVGDKAFSSPGAFGFYPWIEAKKRWWGVLARESYDGVGGPDAHQHPGVMSAFCGREIRAAWVSGKARTR